MQNYTIAGETVREASESPWRLKGGFQEEMVFKLNFKAHLDISR